MEPATPWPPHDQEARPWAQTHRSGTREDRTLRSITVSLPPLIADRTVALDSETAADLEAATSEITKLDSSHADDLSALNTLLLRTESVASSKIEQIQASVDDYARALHGVRANSSAVAMAAATAALEDMIGTPFTDRLVVELMRQLLFAVQHLSDNEIVHNDLHAGNILVMQGDKLVCKVSDLGIAQEMYGQYAVRPQVVHHRIMAPEVLAGGYTTKQSDLYQVGLLLFWMITGESAIPKGLPYADLMRFVSEGEPRRRAEALGTPLGALVAKMLRRREAYRYSSAREVWAELRELRAWKERELFPQR